MKILRKRNFLVLWISQTISNSGDVIFALAVIWYVLISTKSILLVGLVVASSFLPDILIAPFAGTYVDHFNRRSVLMVSYIAQSILVGGAGILYIFHDLGFAFSLVTVLGLGIGEQFATPAYSAMLPVVVERDELIQANGLISSTSSLNMLGSNAVGGLMIVFLGMGAPFEYDAITFLIAAAFLVTLPRAAGAIEKSTKTKVSTVSELRNGYHYLRRDRLLLRLAVLSTLVSFFALGLQGIYAPYVQENLHGGAEVYGLFLSAFALGSIVGSLVIGQFGRNARTGLLIMLGLSGQAIAIMSLGLTHSTVIAISLWVICGVAQVTNMIPYQSFLQVRISPAFYGRVSTLMSAMVYMPAPLLILVTSAVTARVSPGIMLTTYGLAMLLCILVSFAASKDLRTMDIKKNLTGSGVVMAEEN
ncbi:MAG: MFS transporter [Thermoplasmataceae archaeon]